MTALLRSTIWRGPLAAVLFLSLAWSLPLEAQALRRKVPAPAGVPTQVVAVPAFTKVPTPPRLPSVPPPATGLAGLNSRAINTAVQAVPASVPFGRLFSGDSRRATVKVVAPRDGKVVITLAPGAPFRVSEVQVFGLPVSPSMRPVPDQAPTPATGSQMMAGAGRSAPSAMNTNFSNTLLATFTHPPFSIPVREGNELVVTLAFAPKLDLVSGPYVGDHQATLTLDGGAWKASVPVSGRFEGLKIGMIAVMSNPDVVTFSGKLGALSGADLMLTNAEKQPVVAQITAKALPAGFTMAPVNVQVPGGQTRTVPLPIMVSPAMQEGAQQAAMLTVACSGKTKTVPLTFSVYTPFKHFHFEGEDGVQWTISIDIDPSGKTRFGMYAMNPNFVLTRMVYFNIKWKGIHLYTAIASLGKRAFSDYQENKYWTQTMPLVRDHYVEMLQVPPTVEMTYENGSK